MNCFNLPDKEFNLEPPSVLLLVLEMVVDQRLSMGETVLADLRIEEALIPCVVSRERDEKDESEKEFAVLLKRLGLKSRLGTMV